MRLVALRLIVGRLIVALRLIVVVWYRRGEVQLPSVAFHIERLQKLIVHVELSFLLYFLDEYKLAEAVDADEQPAISGDSRRVGPAASARSCARSDRRYFIRLQKLARRHAR